MAKSIKCHQCGAADLIKIEENEYTCKYCHSRIVIEKPKLDLGAFAKTFKAEHLYASSQTTTTPTGKTIVKVSRLGCLLFVAIFLGILTSIIVPIIMSVNRSVNSISLSSTTTKDGWQITYTGQVHYASGSKGSVIWQFTEENYDWKKNRTVLTIINPVTKKELNRQIVIAEYTGSNEGPSLWDLFNGGKIIGDTIFFTPKNNGLKGYNIYTGKVVVENKYLEKIIGNQVAEARAYASSKDDYLEIKDAEGTEYYYFPKQKKIINKEEYRDRKTSKLITRYFYMLVGDHDKKHILRVQQQMKEFENASYFGSLSYREFKNQKKYYSQYRQIYSVDSLPIAHGFFDAEIISFTDSTLIVKYKKNLLEDSPLLVSRYTMNGDESWSVEPSTIKVFKDLTNNASKSSRSYDFIIVNNGLIISINSPQKAAIGINLVTGKTLWTYSREK